MASTRQIFQRRKAVTSLSRVTRTLEMISTSRYRQYSNRRASIEDYHDALATAAVLLSTARVPIEHPLLQDNHSGRSAILAIGSRRGLCGSYNDRIFRLIRIHRRQAQRKNCHLDIYLSSGRLEGILKYHQVEPTQVIADVDEMPATQQMERLTDLFLRQYLAGELDSLGIVYMRYFSASSQKVQTLTVLPLTELVDDLVTQSKVVWPWILTFEDFELSPSADRLIGEVVRMVLHYSILNCFVEAALSEHFARMVAMRNATDNAEDMIKQLTNEYNRARQTQITNELLDIVSGTEALE